MFENYIKVAIRIIIRNKAFTFINISGLAIGMACSILIFLLVYHELTYDRFHEKADRIYRLVPHIYYGGDAKIAVSPAPLGPLLKDSVPEIQKYCRLYILGPFVISNNEKVFREESGVLVDSTFFDIFSFSLIQGDIINVLSNPYSAIVTEKFAKKYFDIENPIGKELTVNNKFKVIITGVLKDFPDNSQLKFNILMPFALTSKEYKLNIKSISEHNYFSYILLDKNINEKALKKINSFYQVLDPESPGELILQPFLSIHLKSDCINDFPENSNIKYVYLFSVIAFFILMIAIINFVNLATARSAKRMKEIGIRKVVGGKRFELVGQFLGESFLMTLMAGLIALGIVEMLLPAINDFTNKQIQLDYSKPTLYIVFTAIVLFTGLLSGSYPAFYLSSLVPVKIIKGKLNWVTGSILFRKILVVFQFSISIVLIFSATIAYQQLNFMRMKKLGFENNNILNIKLQGQQTNKIALIKDSLIKNPNILNVTFTVKYPLSITNSIDWHSETDTTLPSLRINITEVDYNFLETFKIKILKGRNFSTGNKGDTLSYILNETAINKMKLGDGIGQKITIRPDTGVVIGIINDYHFKGLQDTIQPMLLRLSKQTSNFVFIRIRSENMIQTIEYIKSVILKNDPLFPFEYKFVTEEFKENYREEIQTTYLLENFSLLAILISCLGLFGLSSFLCEQKTQESGIRKVLGSQVSAIIVQFSLQFIRLILIANLIALPIAYWSMKNWIENFAYHTEIKGYVFLSTFIISLIIAIFTISYQALKLALANPVNSLRYE